MTSTDICTTLPASPALPRARSVRGVLVALLPAVAFLTLRGAGTLIYWGMAALNHRPIDLQSWDGYWYLGIAEHGYLGAAKDMVDASGARLPDGAMAFFPGYPLLVRGLAVILGHSYLAAGLTISTLAGIAGAYGIKRLARRVTGPRTQHVAVMLYAAAPMAIVYTMAYPEALLIALVAWALVGVLEGRWWLASACTVAAGLVSPMAAPLIPVVIAAAGVGVYRERARWSATVAAMTAPMGLLGYLLWVHQASTTPGAYFAITRAGWDNHIDFGWSTARWVFQALTRGGATFVMITAVIIVAVIPLLVWAWRRLPWQLAVYTLTTYALAVGSAGLVQDRVRLLLSAFPLLLPIAAAMLRRPPLQRAALLAGTLLFGLWFSAHSLSVWHFAI